MHFIQISMASNNDISANVTGGFMESTKIRNTVAAEQESVEEEDPAEDPATPVIASSAWRKRTPANRTPDWVKEQSSSDSLIIRKRVAPPPMEQMEEEEEEFEEQDEFANEDSSDDEPPSKKMSQDCHTVDWDNTSQEQSSQHSSTKKKSMLERAREEEEYFEKAQEAAHENATLDTEEEKVQQRMIRELQGQNEDEESSDTIIEDEHQEEQVESSGTESSAPMVRRVREVGSRAASALSNNSSPVSGIRNMSLNSRNISRNRRIVIDEDETEEESEIELEDQSEEEPGESQESANDLTLKFREVRKKARTERVILHAEGDSPCSSSTSFVATSPESDEVLSGYAPSRLRASSSGSGLGNSTSSTRRLLASIREESSRDTLNAQGNDINSPSNDDTFVRPKTPPTPRIVSRCDLYGYRV